MIKNKDPLLICLFICWLQSCGDTYNIQRPRDPWAFRSVLDKQPRMLTLALDSSMYAAYDLANCKLYKVWKGGVSLQGAAYTNKKNIQPTTWGKSYSDSLQNSWSAELNGKKDSFKLSFTGYRFKNNQIYLNYRLLFSSGDTVRIEERPEYIKNEKDQPGFERIFSLSGVPDGVTVSLRSGTGKIFSLNPKTSSRLITWFDALPPQTETASAIEYDHRGWYWMEKSDCFTCHEIDKNTVGPSFQQIAVRYENEERVMNQLVRKVKNGGTGVWGNSMMNAHPDLGDNEIKTMLDYIFSLKPAGKKIIGTVPSAQKDLQNGNVRPGSGAPLAGMHPGYDVQTIHKNNFRPRVGGLAFLADGRLLVTTWDSIGAVFILDGVESGDTNQIKVKRIASGLAEPLGIEVVDGRIYVLQKQELTRLVDADGDDIIDEFQTVCNSWEVTGDFHEFAFGLVYKDNYFYATLSMAMRLMSHERQKPDRGKTIRISMDGTYEGINYGLRTPNGIGRGVDDELFVADNQGEWVPANKLIHVKKGEYHGMRWGHLDTLNEPAAVAMPAIWLPEDEIGNSPSEPVLIKDGVYRGQMLHGDVTYGGIQRDFIEKINGEYQGAVFRFTQGLEAGVNRLRWGRDGALYIGGVGMVGGWSWKEKQYGLQRMVPNGQVVFDILAIRAKPDGFEIEFTDTVARGIEMKPSDVNIQQWWYLPTADYGGPKKDSEQLKITKVIVSEDRKRIHLVMSGLKKNRVVYFHLPEYIKSVRGQVLWSSEAWYTLNAIP